VSYGELRHRANQAANLFRSLGVMDGDVVLYVLPTQPQLYVTMLGALACGIGCGVNWMLKGGQLAELIRSTRAKVVVALAPTPGFEMWEKLEAIRGELDPAVHVLTVVGPGGAVLPESDLELLAARHSGERLTFTRTVALDDIAAYVHSGGTTGSPKLVKL